VSEVPRLEGRAAAQRFRGADVEEKLSVREATVGDVQLGCMRFEVDLRAKASLPTSRESSA